MNRICLLLLCLVCIGGCSILSRSPSPDFYLLVSPAETGIVHEGALSTSLRVAVGPVTIPGYLNRQQLCIREDSSPTVRVEEFSRWGEPLQDGVTRVLCDALSRKLASRNGAAFPMRAAFQPQWRIAVDIARMDGAPGKKVVLDATWSINDEQGNTVRSGRFTSALPAGDTLSDMVTASSNLLVCLGAELEEMIP